MEKIVLPYTAAQYAIIFQWIVKARGPSQATKRHRFNEMDYCFLFAL